MSQELQTALMAALPVAPAEDGGPQWVHLLPAAGQPVATRDGRGPYRIADAAAVVAATLQDIDTMVLDENHSTDIAAPQGASAPARGWFKDIAQRVDGIWGLVEPTPEGRALIESRAYRHLSPVISHSADGTIRRILRASLVNKPNLRGLTALHQESEMTLLAKLAEVLGLQAEASETDVVSAVTGLKTEKSDDAVALQSQLTEIGTVLGVTSDDGAAVLAAARKAVAGDQATITALQSEMQKLAGSHKDLQQQVAREKAEAFIDGEIRKGRAGLKPMRDHYVSRHMSGDATSVEKEIGAMIIVQGNGTTSALPPDQVSAHAEISPRDLAGKATAYMKKMASEGRTMTYAAAVRAVEGGAA